MLLLEQKTQKLTISLWIFDPFVNAENQCHQEIQQAKIQGSTNSLRELLSKGEAGRIDQIQEKGKAGVFKKALDVIEDAVEQIQPQLILSAATYMAHRFYIPLARKLGCDYIDLGQDLPSMNELQALDTVIADNEEGSRIIQESGLAPGLANILAHSMYERAQRETSGKKVHSVQMRVGGLTQHTVKGGPLHYGPTFSPEGVLFEYEKTAYGLRDGKLVTPTTFTNPEYWESPTDSPIPFGIQPFPIMKPQILSLLSGRIEDEFLQEIKGQFFLQNLEARPTADGTSRMCFDKRYQKTVSHLEYKTLRFFPHYDTWKKLQKDGKLVDLLAKWKQNISDPQISGYPDLVLLRVWAQKTPISTPHSVELVSLHDDVPDGDSSGFTAMQHLTGWPTVLLAFALLQQPAQKKLSNYSKFFLSPNSFTAFGRTLEQVLEKGGLIAPFELIDGVPFLEELTQKERIPLNQTTITSNVL